MEEDTKKLMTEELMKFYSRRLREDMNNFYEHLKLYNTQEGIEKKPDAETVKEYVGNVSVYTKNREKELVLHKQL